MVGATGESPSTNTKRKQFTPETPATSERTVRPRLSAPSHAVESHNMAFNPEGDLAFKLKVLASVPPETEIFRESLQSIVDHHAGAQGFDVTDTRAILNELKSYGINGTKITAAEAFLQELVAKNKVEQLCGQLVTLGRDLTTTQEFESAFLALARGFVSSYSNPALLGGENILRALLSEDFIQRHSSETNLGELQKELQKQQSKLAYLNHVQKDPSNPPLPSSLGFPVPWHGGQQHSFGSRNEAPFQQTEKKISNASALRLNPPQTSIVDTLWGRDRKITFKDGVEVVQTMKGEILSRGRPHEFVTLVPDPNNPYKLLDFGLVTGQGLESRLFGGAFSRKELGLFTLRMQLETILRPFIVANKSKFRDIPGLANDSEVESTQRHGQFTRRTPDYYHSRKERLKRDTSRPSTSRHSPSRAKQHNGLPLEPPRAASVARHNVCSICGMAGHRAWECRYA